MNRLKRRTEILLLIILGIVILSNSTRCFAEGEENGGEPIYVKDSEIFNKPRAIYPCVAKNGLYVLDKNGRLRFVSTVTGEMELLLGDDEGVDIKKTFIQGSQIYVLMYVYDYPEGEGPMQVWVYDVDTFEQKKKVILDSDEKFTKLGVDSKGRIYTAVNDAFDREKQGETIYRFDENGKLIDTSECPVRVYNFAAFDPVNGNVYFEGDKSGAMYPKLYVGKIPEGDDFSSVEWKKMNTLYWRTSGRGITCLENGRYLVHSSWFDDDKVIVVDSNRFDPSEIDEYSSDHSVAICFSKERSIEVSGTIEDVFGNRAVYNPENDSFVLTTDDRHVEEVDLNGDRINSIMETKEHIYSLFLMGDRILALEEDDDGNYLFESTSIKNASFVKIHSEENELEIRASLQLSLEDDTDEKAEIPEWHSENPRIATVSKGGCVYGVSAGTVKITVTYNSGVSDFIILEVKDDPSQLSRSVVMNTSGYEYSNVGKNDYSIHSVPMNSFLYEEDGYIYRLEGIYSYKTKKYGIVLEQYSLDGKYIKSLDVLKDETEWMGGFFRGEDAYYLAFIIWDHSDGSEDLDGLQVKKYDKNWNFIAEGSIYGAALYRVSSWGNLRMTEFEGKIYIHTSNEGYVDSDGQHHQSSGTYIFNESDMSRVHMSYSQVSHSFNQFITVNDGKIYMVDHREGWSEDGPCINRYAGDDELTCEDGVFPFLYKRRNNHATNYDGFSIGGFEVCSDSCLIVYNLDIDGPETNRNVFLSVTDKELKYSRQVQLSYYSADGDSTGRLPQLVKVNDNHFLVLWEEYNKKLDHTVVKMVLVDAEGNLCSETGTLFARLSDCEPIVSSEGYVVWYYTGRPVQEECWVFDEDGNHVKGIRFWYNDSSSVFCYVNPYRIPIKGESGWHLDISGNKVFLDENGQIFVGLKEIDGQQYFFANDGIMQTGTVKLDGKNYNFAETGELISIEEF